MVIKGYLDSLAEGHKAKGRSYSLKVESVHVKDTLTCVDARRTPVNTI